MHHSIAMHYPGLPVWAPCTPDEWKECFQYFLDHDDPMFCSENRLTYDVIEPIKSVYKEHETCLIGIGPSRLYIKNTEYNQVHIYKLKPFNLTDEDLDIIKRSKRCIIIDSDFTTCGASEHIALKIWQLGIPAYVLGLKDKTAGFSRDNLTPTLEEIKSYENDLLRY
jgi:pyruvate/2-oxoglutarate/acetoin dehydrogenase E1 component